MKARQVIAALSVMRNKTEARGIAQVLRSGWFSKIFIKSREAHAHRALVSSRKALHKKCIDLANEVRGPFRDFGLRPPSRVDPGSFDERVRPMIVADPDLSRAVLPLLDARAMLDKTDRDLDRRVKQAASYDAVCLRFMASPGVGPIIPSSVTDLWRVPHELNLQRSITGSSLTGRGQRMTPKTAVAPFQARD